MIENNPRIDSNNSREEPLHNLATETEELSQAASQFMRSLVRAGVSLAFLPVNILPREPRQHFQTAGREFVRGLSTLVRDFADGIEKIAEEPGERRPR